MRHLALICSLALPLAVSGACGTTANSGGETCGGGVIAYSLASGTYQTSSATVQLDGCGLGLTPQDLMVPRMVTRDAMGMVTVSSQDGATALGSGKVTCNIGALTAGPMTLTGPQCQYSLSRSSQAEVTGANQLRLQYTETRSNFVSVAGMQCTQNTSCTISFTLELKM